MLQDHAIYVSFDPLVVFDVVSLRQLQTFATGSVCTKWRGEGAPARPTEGQKVLRKKMGAVERKSELTKLPKAEHVLSLSLKTT